MSFSQRSGIAGTEGWIAPEVLLGKFLFSAALSIGSEAE
jgi:hypothetical protein